MTASLLDQEDYYEEASEPDNQHCIHYGCTCKWICACNKWINRRYGSESADGPYQLIHVTAAASYSDAGLSPYTMYHYLVQAYTGSQFSLPSVPVSAMTPSCGTPVPPCWQCCCPCCGCDPCCCRCNPQNNAIGL
ncbi:MAG: fibronectin type III domain-containing protein [Hungatella hathewayi]|uniref:fibronectin type III domain-containing protein n=2 Tax=Hungatella TaxID=1649459 RepID=UPI00110730B4|nr:MULTISPECIES: fibronectin type III domain-containing protein [Hungatella]MCI6451379.1 fibronectin type III domain-containing protein [Hungatella sp.]MCI7383934.1 fibronectin type III domain-containing protein [Hungatella sp.]MDU4973581.1 fibronectin type III domain-containing protein [Hungatella hathewayi]MDY6236982.1 fibronectin type III domain-containing protein [Hungatella hathewayi]